MGSDPSYSSAMVAQVSPGSKGLHGSKDWTIPGTLGKKHQESEYLMRPAIVPKYNQCLFHMWLLEVVLMRISVCLWSSSVWKHRIWC